MLAVREISCHSIISRSRLPGVDFVINPYRGCAHACAYCYVQNMPQVSDRERRWGSYVDVKINALNVLPKHLARYYHQSLYLSSVTDCYQPLEAKYQLTRRLLARLVVVQPDLTIQTKSALILRDLDLLKQFAKVTVGMTIVTSDDLLRQQLEPGAAAIEARLYALQTLHAEGFTTYIFIGPLLPYLTDWQTIVERTKEFTTYYYFDWLNTRGCLWPAMVRWLERFYPDLIPRYQAIYDAGKSYWDGMRREIATFCQEQRVEPIICF